MRIAMIGPFGLHPNKTMASRALGLARPLTQQGHAVKLFMPPWHTPEEADREWTEDGVTLRYIPLRGGAPGIVWRLVRETLVWQPDVVHCFKPKAYSGLAGWWLWQFHRRRLPLVMDNDDWEGWGGWNDKAPYPGWQKHVFAWQERWGMTHCHTLTVASRALETIAWSLGVSPQRVAYVPNGPGIARGDGGRRPLVAGSGKRPPTILLYSRLFEFDVKRLVEILAGVRAAVPHLKILSVGAGLYAADADQFRQEMAAANLLDAVEDAGWVEPEALPALLARADVGLYLMEDTLLNRAKCPVKLADMLAAGVPVVAEAVGQVTEYVRQDETGRLRPSGDNAGLTADLIHLLQNPAERGRLSRQARALMAESFDWAQLAAGVAQVYEQLAA